jgi:hypothetical protein
LDTLVQVVFEDPVPPRHRQRGVPSHLEAICLKCLQKDPARRYPRAQALAEDLREFREGRPTRGRAG